ncbi:flagellar hook-length control protein FliK [Frateuria defendens]|uniref:flagellar hook-length control protein FliK n=1 Tax=Frateuria defendens TaxID=2219559 RepID=UPI00066FC850|nr:flagellar hook-length control protein FliK [Frateuria defendens]
MNIQPTSLAALTWASAAAGTTAESWRIGAVLAARPLGVNERGLMVLQIGGMAVEAELPGGQLPGGQLPPQFQVRVQSLGSQPLLEILAASAAETTVQRGLRERLPQQDGYAPLLATLGALSQRPVLRQLPQPLREALALLEHGIRTPEDITRGEGLREAIQRSGLFLEAQLTTPRADLAALAGNDWKAILLHLAAVLERQPPPRPVPPSPEPPAPPPLAQRGLQPQPRQASMPTPRQPMPAMESASASPPEAAEAEALSLAETLVGRLHGDVRAALARVEVAQLDAAAAQAWMIEIPLQGQDGRDVLQLQLQLARDSEDGNAFWTFGFAIDLPALGPVQGELQLRDLRLAVRLWAERSATTEKLERQFGTLRQRLAAVGVLLDQLSCQTGLPHGNGRAGALLLKATA